MPVEVIMPKVDMDMDSGKIARWHVAAGDAVDKGDALFDIETDKAAMEVEAPAAGLLAHPVPEGTVVAIGAAVAWLYAPGEPIGPAPAQGAVAPGPSPAETPLAPPPAATPPAPAAGPGRRATPLARSLARGAGIEIATLTGSGPAGRVQACDVRAALPPAVGDGTGPLAVTRARGGSGTPLLLLHGFAADSGSWALLEAQMPGRRVIRVDLPGHGRSPRQRIGSFADLAARLRDTLDTLDADRVHLVGHSLGGALALALADTRPRKIAALTLIAPAGLGPQINAAALAGICRATRAESLAPWLRCLVADAGRISDGYVRQVMAARQDPALRAAQTALAEVLFPDGVQAFDLRAALDRLSCPTALIWGRRDEILPWRQALCAPGRVALHLFDGLGHLPQIEAPEAVAGVLARLPA